MTEIPDDVITITALPPHNASSIVFRTAVYQDPSQVKIRIPADIGDVDIWVAEMLPGTQFIVRSGDEQPGWTALLTCQSGGLFRITDAAARPSAPPPDSGEGAGSTTIG